MTCVILLLSGVITYSFTMIMNFLKQFDPTPINIAKLATVLAAALVVLALAAQLLAPNLPLSLAPGMNGMGGGSDSSYPSEMGISYSSDYADGGYGYATAKPASSPMAYGEAGMATLSSRNVIAINNISPSMPPTPPYGGTTGANAEEFEVTEYSASIETGNREETCGAIAELKAKTYVIFESSNSYDHGCSFSFKVEHASAPEVLAWLTSLDPKYLNENTYTIKRQLDDFTSEEDILKKKLVEIDSTLASAVAAYAEVTRLATQTRDAASLAQIIQSRIQIIQQLTQERLNVNEQLDRLSRAKANQLDHLEYTYFRVDVSENKYIDTRYLGESWKQALRDVVRVVNEAVQGMTVNLLALFFIVLQWSLYALILLVIVKYGWHIARRIWNS